MRTPQRARIERLEARRGGREGPPEVVCFMVGADLTEEERAVLARRDVIPLAVFGPEDHILADGASGAPTKPSSSGSADLKEGRLRLQRRTSVPDRWLFSL